MADAHDTRIPESSRYRLPVLAECILVKLQFGERYTEEHLVERKGKPCLRQVVAVDKVLHLGIGKFPLRISILQFLDLVLAGLTESLVGIEGGR